MLKLHSLTYRRFLSKKNQKVRLNLREMNMNMEVLCASGDGGDILFILFFNPHISEHRYLLQM